MGDTRHKRKHPTAKRMQMTERWKQRVRDRLAENRRNNISPRDQVELATAIGASDKSSITKMLRPKATSSAFVADVSRVLQIPLPVYEHEEPDDLDVFLNEELTSVELRSRALAILRAALGRRPE